MDLNAVLTAAIKHNASDVHMKIGLPPIFRVYGKLMPIKAEPLRVEDFDEARKRLFNEDQERRFIESHELDCAYSVPGVGRFRVNVFRQRGSVGMVFRVISTNVKSFADLYLPKVLEKISSEERGLILCTGTTGSGKSTTLASIVDYINTNRSSHVITIEDPIEFLMRDKKSIINQRELGVDTNSFAVALKSALRQDPDVLLVGEMRDLETISTAITAAETGHLVLSTLHTLDATETINRIIGIFPPHHQKQVRLQLSAILKAVISQRLVPRMDGNGRVPAVEIMINTARVNEYIEDKDKTKKIREAIQQGYVSYGMQTFDQSLMALYKEGHISLDEALRQASNPDDFRLRLQGVSSTSDLTWDDFEKKDQPPSG